MTSSGRSTGHREVPVHGHRVESGAVGGSFEALPWAWPSSILTGHASIREQTGCGEGSFGETLPPFSPVVLFMSTCGHSEEVPQITA